MLCKVLMGGKFLTCSGYAEEWLVKGGLATIKAELCPYHATQISGEKPHWEVIRTNPKKSLWRGV